MPEPRATPPLPAASTPQHTDYLPPVAVMITLYINDPLNEFELALTSVEDQRCRRAIRIYLCCDGPLDATQDAWLEKNTHRFYRIIRNPVNLGLAAALNKLIEELEDEEYIFRMDGDDISLPGRFAAQIALMASDPELALVGCQAEDIDDEGNVIGPRCFPTDPDAILRSLGRFNPLLHPSFCLRRNVLRNSAIRYPQAYLCEDLAFVITVAANGGKLGNCYETLFQWRTGTNFFKRRRDYKRGWAEMCWYFRGLKINGRLLSTDIIYPPFRFILRVLPTKTIRWIYSSQLREYVSKH